MNDEIRSQSLIDSCMQISNEYLFLTLPSVTECLLFTYISLEKLYINI